MPFDPETERIRRIYDKNAATSAQPRGDHNLRWLCGQAEGETLEAEARARETEAAQAQGVLREELARGQAN